MVEKTLTGSVVDESGNVVGSVEGTYIDDYQDGASEQINTVTVNATVVDESGNSVGSGQLQYEDYVTYDGGGTRTIDVSGNVVDESGNIVGTVSGSLEDQYGAVTQKIPTHLTLTVEVL